MLPGTCSDMLILKRQCSRDFSLQGCKGCEGFFFFLCTFLRVMARMKAVPGDVIEEMHAHHSELVSH